MKILNSNSLKKLLFACCVVLISTNVQTLYASNDCNYRSFNIKVSDKVTTNELLSQLSDECSFSMITNDPIAKERMKEELFGINIKNMTLTEIFDILLADKNIDYDYKNSVLKISGLFTKTFKMDYVNTVRTGKSNTDISLTGDDNAETGGNGGKLSTGASITSDDSFQFWSKMDKELNSVLNTPEDTFKAPAPIINPEAGLVTITGTKKQLKRIEKYIDQLMDRLHKQVMIDVKILTVNLDDSRTTGINWSEIFKLQNNIKFNFRNPHMDGVSEYTMTEGGGDESFTLNPALPHINGTFFKISSDFSFTDVVKFLNTQGDVTSVSNPKVITLSNQPAVFSSGDQLYYKLLQSTSTTAQSTTTNSNEIVKSVFAGILLDITPEITDDGEIILKINPSISSVKQEVKLDDNGIRKLPPDLMKKQISSVVKLTDGEKIVLGGLISTRKGSDINKVPILGNIPILGYAFKQEQVKDIREELVLIITPHIISYKKGSKNKTISLKDLGYQGVSE